MAEIVLDRSAMIAFLEGEPGGPAVNALIQDENNHAFAHVINLCEVRYHFYRSKGALAADDALDDLSRVGVVFRHDIDADFWRDASDLKATLVKVSLADCFLLALGRGLQATVVTTDHHEFDALVPLNVCPIRFAR